MPPHGSGVFGKTAFARKMEFVFLQNKIAVNPWFRVDPVFLRRYNKKEHGVECRSVAFDRSRNVNFLEVNAEQWTRIIVEVEPPARWIRKQKQLRSRLRQQ